MTTTSPSDDRPDRPQPEIFWVDPSPEFEALRRDPPPRPKIRPGMKTDRLDPVSREWADDQLDRMGW